MFPATARSAADFHAAWRADSLHTEAEPVPGTLWSDMAAHVSGLLHCE